MVRRVIVRPLTFLSPPDTADVAYEFFSPFAHVPGRYEWCRIRSPTHGVFDTFIALDPRGTDHAATVYVSESNGVRFMEERYPECRTVRVPTGGLHITEHMGGRSVAGVLHAPDAPIVSAEMTLGALADAVATQHPYGGSGKPVWGSRWTCWGVDLELAAVADGRVQHRDGRVEEFRATPAVVTLGSFGRLALGPRR